KKTDKILFVKIKNDGTDLGARRMRIEENDLPSAKETIENFIRSIGLDREDGFVKSNEVEAEIIRKGEILENGSFSLSLNVYKADERASMVNWPLMKITE